MRAPSFKAAVHLHLAVQISLAQHQGGKAQAVRAQFPYAHLAVHAPQGGVGNGGRGGEFRQGEW
jgi:hypothetical protein